MHVLRRRNLAAAVTGSSSTWGRTDGGESPVSASVKFLHRYNQCALTKDNGKGLMAETSQTYIGMVVRNHLGSVVLSAGRQISNVKGAEEAKVEALKFGLQVLADAIKGEVISSQSWKTCHNLNF